MTSNLGEALRAALMTKQLTKDTQPEIKPILPAKPVRPQNLAPGRIINNVNRATFYQVRDFPGTRTQVLDAMEAKGFNRGSVTSLIGMMLRQKLVVEDSSGVLRSIAKDYVPLKNSRAYARAAAAAVKEKIKAEKAAARKKVVIVPKETRRPVSVQTNPAPVQTNPVPTVDSILNSLNITQARALYDALHNIFGGAK